jgi:hypothetical protein
MIPKPFAERWLERIRRWNINQARRRFPELRPRLASNAALRDFCHLFEGDVVNVSGFMDKDKETGFYRDYFPKAFSYTITNYAGSGEIGDGAPGSIYLDLEGEPDPDMHRKFDTALCHTVLEHIQDIQAAMTNLSHITRSSLIIVVPFIQDEHYRPGIFGDYWRYTPLGLKALYEQHGFEMRYLHANDNPWYPVYLTAVGVRPESDAPELPPSPWNPDMRVARNTYVFDGCAW